MCWIHHKVTGVCAGYTTRLQGYVLDTPHKENLYKFSNTSLTILYNKHFLWRRQIQFQLQTRHYTERTYSYLS
jgi:hypothetical protein